MLRIDTRMDFGVLGLCALAAWLLLGCGSAEQSHALSAARDLVTRLGGELPGGGQEEVAEGSSRFANEPVDEGLTRDSRRAGEVIVIEGGEASEVAEPEDDSSEPALYSYIDATGGAHFVRGLHNVPEPHRVRARNLSGSGGPVINRYESKVVPTRRRTVVASQPDYNPNRLDVVLYSADWCGACRKAKNLLDEEGVAYEVRDIDHDLDAKDEVRRILGSVRIPLLDIAGTYVSGYDPEEIRRLLRRG